MPDKIKGVVRITIVAGEKSSDLLAANLIRVLRSRIGQLEISGICGSAMIEEGALPLYSTDDINSIGFESLLSRIFGILRIRKQLIEEVLRTKPDLYIGVDAPDFNLSVEQRVRRAGIPTIQYVAPTIWAWRAYRIHKVKKAVTKLLTIYPFESRLYEKATISYTFVGHPLADEIKEVPEIEVRHKFEFETTDRVIALLPGSRLNEVKRLAPIFIATAARLAENDSRYQFISATANDETHDIFVETLQRVAPGLSIRISKSNSHEVIAASNLVLLASGTAALEAAFFAKPVVVAYQVSALSYALIKLLSRVESYSILNHLGESPVLPEFVQKECTVDNLVNEISKIFHDDIYRLKMVSHFRKFKTQLKRDANLRACEAVLDILNDQPK